MINYLITSKSSELICLEHTKQSLLINSIAPWWVLSLLFTEITQNLFGDLTIVFALSATGLLLIILIRSYVTKISIISQTSTDIESAEECIRKLHLISWMQNLSENKFIGDDTRIYFLGFVESFIGRNRARTPTHGQGSGVSGGGGGEYRASRAGSGVMRSEEGLSLISRARTLSNHGKDRLEGYNKTKLIDYMIGEYLEALRR